MAAVSKKLFVDRVTQKVHPCQPQRIVYALMHDKSDNGKENVKMANIVVTIMTVLMALCATAKIL